MSRSLGAMIEELIDLKVAGEPEYNEFRSITENSAAKLAWQARIDELKLNIDAIVERAAP